NLPGSKQLSARAWRLACQTAVYVLRMHPSVRTERGLIFHYTPVDRARIVNASALLAAFLARMARAAARRPADSDALREAVALARQARSTEERHRLDKEWRGGSLASECWGAAADAALAALAVQEKDGSWRYGESPRQRWRDSFHTGYALLALKQLRGELWAARKAADSLEEWPADRQADLFDDLADALERGFDDYLARFFPGQDGMV